MSLDPTPQIFRAHGFAAVHGRRTRCACGESFAPAGWAAHARFHGLDLGGEEFEAWSGESLALARETFEAQAETWLDVDEDIEPPVVPKPTRRVTVRVTGPMRSRRGVRDLGPPLYEDEQAYFCVPEPPERPVPCFAEGCPGHLDDVPCPETREAQRSSGEAGPSGSGRQLPLKRVSRGLPITPAAAHEATFPGASSRGSWPRRFWLAAARRWSR